MIYCNLKGGLGNMLFQIAAVKSFAIDIQTECSFPNLHQHLNYLNNDNFYNPNLNHSVEYLEVFKNLLFSPITNDYRIITYPFEYSDNKPSDNTLIDGFFQSEKYFLHNRKNIINYITLPNIDIKYLELLNKTTTSIHVRRGDYVNHPNHHPTQDLSYYLEGIDLLKLQTDLFIIFSDDIQWCKDNLKIKNSVYIENEKDYIEMKLMSLCNNNIISNSSFSWWGAWLNEHNDKIVIGPKKWFGSAIQHNTNDILPKGWIKI